MDDYERRYAAALDELEAAGVWSSNANPPYNIVARKLGSRPRPPHYDPFWKIVPGYWLWFAVVWGGFMWLTSWRTDGTDPTRAILSALIAGAVFAFLMALYYAESRRRYGLSEWRDL